MKDTLSTISSLINEFSKLPGVGQKTAQRYAYKIIDMKEDEAEKFANAILAVKEKVDYCSVCGSFCDKVEKTAHKQSCQNCNKVVSTIVVVAWPKDVQAIARIKTLKCSFHILHGTISPLDGRSVDDIRIKELVERLRNEKITEIVLALNPDVEGETTGLYISRLLKPIGTKVTRLATGISMGSDLEYADELTLTEAYDARREI